jgi:hypothetical protein
MTTTLMSSNAVVRLRCGATKAQKRSGGSVTRRWLDSSENDVTDSRQAKAGKRHLLLSSLCSGRGKGRFNG